MNQSKDRYVKIPRLVVLVDDSGLYIEKKSLKALYEKNFKNKKASQS